MSNTFGIERRRLRVGPIAAVVAGLTFVLFFATMVNQVPAAQAAGTTFTDGSFAN